MTVPKINWSHGDDTRNIINRAIEVLNAQGKTIQDLVADGQLTDEQYAKLLTIINGMVKSGEVKISDLTSALRKAIENSRQEGVSIGLNDLSSDVIAALDSAGSNTFELLSIPRERSVSPRKTTFFDISTNLYNANTAKKNKTLDPDTGETVDSESNSSSDFIEVDPGVQYVTKGVAGVAVYSESQSYIERLWGYEGSFVPPSNARYVKLIINNTSVNTAQLNRGNEVLEYEPYYAKLPDDILPSIQDKSITPRMTTFFELSSNLYNKNTAVPNANIDSTTGEVVESGANGLSDYISVVPGMTYTSNQVFSLSYFDSDKKFIQRVAHTSGTFVVPAGVHFVRLSINMPNLSSAQLNEGSVLLSYEDYFDPRITLAEGSLPLNAVAFTERSNNLYNKDTVIPNTYIDTGTGVLAYSEANSTSDFIAVEPNTAYTPDKAHTVGFYTDSKSFIGRVYTSNETFTTPSDARFIRITVSNPHVPIAQLNKGSELLEYDAYYMSIAKDALPPKLAKDAREKTYYFSPEELVKPYEARLGEFTDFSTPDDFHSAFNTLAETYPDYLTGFLKGKDQSDTYDIYQYEAEPQPVSGSDRIKKTLPKFVFVVGLHGEEKTSIFAMYHFIKDICENWQNDPVLEYLRWNVQMVFIPLANPWCFVNGVRHNVNSVDLNRNFPHLWDELTGNEYSGTKPLSEKEAQYVAEMLDDNTDAVYFGDFHTNGSTSTYEGYDRLMWFPLLGHNTGMYDEDVAITARYTVEKMSREYVKNHGMPTDVGYLGYISDGAYKGAAKSYGTSLGIPSSSFETFIKLPTETERFSGKTIQMGTEFLGNWTLNLVKHYRTVY